MPPSLRHNATTNRYRVTIKGRDYWLGSDKDEAERGYYRLMLELKSGTLIEAPKDDVRIVELVNLYTAAMVIYFKSNPGSWHRGKRAMDFLTRLAGSKRPDQFGMRDLDLLRDDMGTPQEYKTDAGETRVRPALCRTGINRCMAEIAKFWKWCARKEYVPADLYAKCLTMEPLVKGHCDARETEKVQPADPKAIKKVKAVVNASVRAMIELQELTGARPGEVCGLKAEMIDRTVDPWHCELVKHKTVHRGKERHLFFGPKAQKVLAPFLLRRAPGDYLFQPADHWTERTEKKTGKGRREGQAPTKRATDRTVNDHYGKDSYGQCIERACVKAGVPHWTPNQIRHTRATEIRKERGIEAAGAVLGHAHLNTTEIYAEVNLELARKVAAEMG
jgi:integrase